MKIIFCILTIVLTNSVSFADNILIDDQGWSVHKLGKYYFATPIAPEVFLTKSTNSNAHLPTSQVDCKKIKKVIENSAKRINTCTEDNTSLPCKYTKKIISDYGTEVLVPGLTPEQYFRIEYKLENREHLKGKIAQAINVDPKRVKIQNELSATFRINNIEIHLDQDSLMKKTSKLNLFSSTGIMSHYFDQYLLVENRLLYCDILDRKAHIQLNIENELANREKISSKTKSDGFKVYDKLKKYQINADESKTIQAANIGFEIGSTLDRNQSELKIKDLFKKLIIEDKETLILKEVANESDFNEKIFPDLYFTKKINQNFSTKVLQ